MIDNKISIALYELLKEDILILRTPCNQMITFQLKGSDYIIYADKFQNPHEYKLIERIEKSIHYERQN